MAANVSRDLFNKAKNYITGIFQQGKPPMDADINDARMCLYYHIKDLGYYLGVHGFSGVGFSVTNYAPQPNNNIAIVAGYGYCYGARMYQADTASVRLDAKTTSNRNLCSTVSNVVGQTITDNRMNWTSSPGDIDNNPSGRTVYFLTPDGDTHEDTVAGWTSTTFTTTNPMSVLVQPGCSYAFSLPAWTAGTIYQLVCLNCFMDQVDAAEDPTLYHALAGGTEIEQRWKFRFVVETVPSATSSYDPAELPNDYTDILGNDHFYMPLAVIERNATEITAANIAAGTDARDFFYEISDYVLKAGDTMTGDLNMDDNKVTGDNAEVDFDAGDMSVKTVSIRDSGGTEQLCLASHLDSATAPPALKVYPAAGLYSSSLSRVKAADPLYNADLTTKGYVDEQVRTHSHDAYVAITNLGLTALADVEDLCIAQFGSSTFPVGNTLRWDHNLASSFLIVQLQIRPTTGIFMDTWINGEAEFDWAQVSPNSITITNNGVASIDGTRLRIAVFRADLTDNTVVAVADSVIPATFFERNIIT